MSSNISAKERGAVVLVSTYNRPRALTLVLGGLARQSIAPTQIIIADDGSTEETRRVVNAWIHRGLPIEHCWQEDRGYRKTKVMNDALTRARPGLCIFLDGDCVPFPDFVSNHLSMAEPKHISAGSRVLASERFTNQLEAEGNIGQLDSWRTWISRRLKGDVNRINQLVYLPDGPWRKMQSKNWRLVRGCNFAVRLEDVLAVDGFEESLEGWGPDDSELTVRLLNNGLLVKNLRFAVPVLHLWHKEESRQNITRHRGYLQEAIETKKIHAAVGISSRRLSKIELP
jgi:glycosyltransferase involved in cell wall biosynthesis